MAAPHYQLSQLTLNPSSSCFVPSSSAKPLQSKKNKEAATEIISDKKTEDETSTAEKYHAGSSKWGKYKKKEKEAKKRRSRRQGSATETEDVSSPASIVAVDNDDTTS